MRCSHNCQQCACTASNAHVRQQAIEYLNISGLVIDFATSPVRTGNSFFGSRPYFALLVRILPVRHFANYQTPTLHCKSDRKFSIVVLVSASFQIISRLLGRLGSVVRVSVSFQSFALRMFVPSYFCRLVCRPVRHKGQFSVPPVLSCFSRPHNGAVACILRTLAACARNIQPNIATQQNTNI